MCAAGVLPAIRRTRRQQQARRICHSCVVRPPPEAGRRTGSKVAAMKTWLLVSVAILSAVPVALLIVWDLPGLGILIGLGLLAYALSLDKVEGQGKVHVMGRMQDSIHRRAA